MVTDALLAPVLSVVQWVLDLLPDGQPPALPDLDLLWDALAGIDSLVPILGPLTFMVGLLGAVVAFVVARIVLTVWNLIWP